MIAELILGIVVLVFLVAPCFGLLIWWLLCTEINRYRFRKSLNPEYDQYITLFLNVPFWRLAHYAKPEHKD